MGVTTTVLPNSLSKQIRAHVPPILDGTKAHRTKHGRSGQRGQKLNAHCVPTLQGKLLMLDKEEDGRT
jgi:hypothetical protein